MFAHVLASSLVVSVANFTIWFAVTFWTYLETRSVLATGLIAGIFLVATAATGIWFGSLVDHHRKQVVIQASAVASFVFYALGLGLYLAVPESEWRDAASPLLWVFVVVLMLGVIAGNLRGIALPTLVTLLVPEHRPRPRQRPRRHDVRRLVPRHVGDQRPARRLRRDALGAGAGAGR